MSDNKLTRTFGALAVSGLVALTNYTSNAKADETNSVLLPVITSSYFTNEVTPLSTNKVFKINATNAVSGQVYTLQRRTYLTDGENLGHTWVSGPNAKAKADGTLNYTIGDFKSNQEFYRISAYNSNTNVQAGVTNATK